jgi:hypothetical protein
MSELDLLRSLGDQILPPSFDALRETAQRRAHRAKMATGLVVAATVAAVSATTAYVDRGDRRVEPAPPPPAPSSRPLTYADGSTIHYGDDSVEAEGPVVELDLTDYGVGFRTDDGRIWFSDGSTPEKVGELGTTGPGYGDNNWPLTSHPNWMLSSNAGSRLVWFEFPSPGDPEIVVYDTGSGREIVRDTVALGPGHTAVPAELTERFVYWFKDPTSEEMPEDQVQFRYDPATREQSRITEPELLADLDEDAAERSVRLKGDGRWDTAPNGFHYSNGLGQQMGLDLQQGVAGINGVAPVGAGDMVAKDVDGRPFAFEPPSDYTDKSGVAWLVQWLDNQTVVVVSPLRDGTDLMACHLDTGRCEVAESAPAGIVVPELGKSRFIG